MDLLGLHRCLIPVLGISASWMVKSTHRIIISFFIPNFKISFLYDRCYICKLEEILFDSLLKYKKLQLNSKKYSLSQHFFQLPLLIEAYSPTHHTTHGNVSVIGGIEQMWCAIIYTWMTEGVGCQFTCGFSFFSYSRSCVIHNFHKYWATHWSFVMNIATAFKSLQHVSSLIITRARVILLGRTTFSLHFGTNGKKTKSH